MEWESGLRPQLSNGRARATKHCAPLPWQMKIHGGDEAMYRALNHVPCDRHLLPTLASAAQCTNAPLVGSPSSGAHGANSLGR
jgi:hypothetical protein